MTSVIESLSEEEVKTILDSKLLEKLIVILLAFNVLNYECFSVDFLSVLF